MGQPPRREAQEPSARPPAKQRRRVSWQRPLFHRWILEGNITPERGFLDGPGPWHTPRAGGGGSELEGGPGHVWFPRRQEVSFSSHLQEGEGRGRVWGVLFPAAAALARAASFSYPPRSPPRTPPGPDTGVRRLRSLLHPLRARLPPAWGRPRGRSTGPALPGMQNEWKGQEAKHGTSSEVHVRGCGGTAGGGSGDRVIPRSQAGPVPRQRGCVSDLQALSFRALGPAILPTEESRTSRLGSHGTVGPEPGCARRLQGPGRGSWRTRPARGPGGGFAALDGAGGGGASWGGFAHCPT